MSQARATRSVPIRALLALAILAGLVGFPAQASHKTIVTPGAMAGWSIVTEGAGAATFVDGPGTPPSGGLGSISLATPDAGDRVFVESNVLGGTPLKDIGTLTYTTYRVSGSPALAPTLQLFVDLDGNKIFTYDADDVLTFEPYLQTGGYGMVPGAGPVPSQCAGPCVVAGVWQTWNAAQGAWWTRSGGIPGPPLDTLANYAANHPTAAIALGGQAGAGLKIAAGSSGPSWAGFEGAVDTIDVQGALYDFERVSLVVDCNATSDDIAAVQGAVDAARDGDTIQLGGVCDFTAAKPHGGDTTSITTTAVLIRPGTPFQTGVTIESDGPSHATILGAGTQTAFMVAPGNDNVTIRGLNLIGFARPIVVWSTQNTTIGDAAATTTPSDAGNRIVGEAMNSAILALGNNKDAFGADGRLFIYYGPSGRQNARIDNTGELRNLRVLGNYITYGAVDIPDGTSRDVVAIDVRQKNQGNVDGVEIANNAVGFLTPNFPSFNINAVRVHAHSGDPNYHLRNVSIHSNNLGRLEELVDPIADVNAGGRAAIVLVRAKDFDISGNGLRAFQSPTGVPMPGGGIVVSDSSDGVVGGNGIIVAADPSTLKSDLGAIGIVDDINALFGSPAGGVGSSNIKVTGNIIGPVTTDAPLLGSQRGIVVNGSSLVDVTGNTVKFASDAAINIGVTVNGPTLGVELPRTVTSSLFCGNLLEGVEDDPAEVLVESSPVASSFPTATSFAGNGECVPADVAFTPSDGSTQVAEGGGASSYSARLTLRPSANVTVTPAFGAQLLGVPASLTFTPANWITPQTVSLTAVDDIAVEGTTVELLAHSMSSSDAAYAALSPALPVTIQDNDTGTVLVIESDGSTVVVEGGTTDTFTVALSAPPPAPVTITFDAGDQLGVSPATLTFDTATFATPQTVTVTAVDDTVREGIHSGSITGASSDPLFGSVPAILATIADNDLPAAPVIEFPGEDQILTATAVTVSGDAEPGATVEIFEGATSVGTAVADGSGDWSAVISFAANATHTITAVQTGTDSLTGPASAPRTFSIDTIPPADPVITSPASGTHFVVQTVTVEGTGEPGSTLLLHDNGGLKTAAAIGPAGTWSITEPFTAGSHTLTARSSDEAGNLSAFSAPVTITVALLTPTIIAPTEGAYAASPVVVHGKADTTHDWVYLYDFGVLQAIVPIVHENPGVWSVETPFASGAHRLTAVSRTAGGAFSPPSPVRSFTVDNQPPTAVVHRPQFYTVLGVVLDGEINGTARDGATFDSGIVKVDLVYRDALGAEVAVATAACSDCPGAFVHWSDTPDLLPGPYTVEAYATDKVGNVSAAGTMTFVFV